jgi:hypothetical protein
MTKSLLTLCVILVSLNLPARAGWMTPQGGQMPPNVMVAGQDGNGRLFHICRAGYEGGIHPGIVDPDNNCHVSYDGIVYSLTNYEVLVDSGYSWVPVYNGEIPFDALPAGREPQGDALYICRGDVNSQWHPGKIGHAYSGCSVPYQGRELKTPWYEVLVGN